MNTPRDSGLASPPGNQSRYPKTISSAVHASASAEANATTRRDADSAASSGTTTSQIAAKDSMPPVVIATVMTKPASASDDSTWAPSYRPVRDRNHDSKMGAISHANAATARAVGAPGIAR